MSIVRSIYAFYRDGFRSMTIGKTLWMIIIIKLIVLFAIIRLLFFPNILKENYDSDLERAEAVRDAMTTKNDRNCKCCRLVKGSIRSYGHVSLAICATHYRAGVHRSHHGVHLCANR